MKPQAGIHPTMLNLVIFRGCHIVMGCFRRRLPLDSEFAMNRLERLPGRHRKRPCRDGRLHHLESGEINQPTRGGHEKREPTVRRFAISPLAIMVDSRLFQGQAPEHAAPCRSIYRQGHAAVTLLRNSMSKDKKPRGRPTEKQMPPVIPDTPENIARAIMQGPPKKEWDYLKKPTK